ncbi:hypothetical protein HYH02_013764, partial [Chlamydomonas schloesseri]
GGGGDGIISGGASGSGGGAEEEGSASVVRAGGFSGSSLAAGLHGRPGHCGRLPAGEVQVVPRSMCDAWTTVPPQPGRELGLSEALQADQMGEAFIEQAMCCSPHHLMPAEETRTCRWARHASS